MVEEAVCSCHPNPPMNKVMETYAHEMAKKDAELAHAEKVYGQLLVFCDKLKDKIRKLEGRE